MVTVFAQIYALLDALISNLLALRLDKRMELKLSSFDVLISFCNKCITISYCIFSKYRIKHIQFSAVRLHEHCYEKFKNMIGIKGA